MLLKDNEVRNAAIGTQSERRRWMSLALVVTAQFMVILDVTIVNVALPSIQRDLGFAQENLQWVITAYTIMFGGALLLGGRLGDLLGRRRLLLVGLALFSFSSLLCGLAWSEASLIAFRAAQGLGAALLVPAALALLISTFAEGPQRNRALGIYGAVSGSGAAVGVLLGGLLTTYLSWPWIFLVNVPVGIGAIALTPVLLAESRAALPHRRFDLAGASSVTTSLMLLVYALTRATSDGWAASTTLALLATSVALLLAFVAIELRSKAPLLPLRFFRMRTPAVANATIAIVGAGVFSEFFLLTLYMQDALHFSPVRTGAGFAALALAAILAANAAQAAVGRLGVRPVLTGGLLALSFSAALLSRVPVDAHYFRDLFPALLLGGAGLGVSFVSATIGSLTGVRPSDAGVASGLVNTSRQIGGAVGLAAISAIAAASSSSYVDSHPEVQVSSARALTHGVQTGFYVLTGLLLFGALIAATLVKSRPPSLEAEHAQLSSSSLGRRGSRGRGPDALENPRRDAPGAASKLQAVWAGPEHHNCRAVRLVLADPRT